MIALLLLSSQRLPGFPPLGFTIALVDFAFTVLCAHFAASYYKPATFLAWVFFVLFIILAVLFFFAWIIDLGAHL